jgi:hypothetical protein
LNLFARLLFAIVDRPAPQGLAGSAAADSPEALVRQRARRTGVRGETQCLLVSPSEPRRAQLSQSDVKGEIDIVGYDGRCSGKTCATTEPGRPGPEEAVNEDERRYLC